MCILNKIGEGRDPGAGPITPVVGHNEINFLLMVKRRDLVIITHHLTIPVKKKKPWPFVMPRVESARDGNTLSDQNREVEGI
jgi:hypothetical protein